MTGELRPAVYVVVDVLNAAERSQFTQRTKMQNSVRYIEDDRQAVRAEQDAEIAALKYAWEAQHKERVAERAEAKLWFEQAQEAKTELAKWKALAETLAGALEQMHRAVCHETGFAEAVRADSGLAYPWEPLDVAADASLKALREYKEASDA